MAGQTKMVQGNTPNKKKAEESDIFWSYIASLIDHCSSLLDFNTTPKTIPGQFSGHYLSKRIAATQLTMNNYQEI